MADRAAPGYRIPARRADAAVIALWLALGGAVLGIGTDVRRIVLIGDFLRDPTLLGTASDADGPVAVATVVGLLTMVVALVLVGRWALLVRANARAIGAADGGGGVALRRGPARAALLAVALVVVAVLLVRFGISADTPRGVRSADWLDVLVQALLALLAVAGLVVVPRVSSAQVLAARDRGVRPDVAPDDLPRPADEGGLRVRTEEEVRRARADQRR